MPTPFGNSISHCLSITRWPVLRPDVFDMEYQARQMKYLLQVALYTDISRRYCPYESIPTPTIPHLIFYAYIPVQNFNCGISMWYLRPAKPLISLRIRAV